MVGYLPTGLVREEPYPERNTEKKASVRREKIGGERRVLKESESNAAVIFLMGNKKESAT